MRVTVEVTERDLEDILRFTGKKKKGPAVTRFIADRLALRRQAGVADEHDEANPEADRNREASPALKNAGAKQSPGSRIKSAKELRKRLQARGVDVRAWLQAAQDLRR